MVPAPSAQTTQFGATRHPRKSAEREEIEMIEGDGVHAHPYIRGRAQRWNRKIGNDLQLLHPAVGGDRERSHAWGLPLYLITNPKRQRRDEQRALLTAGPASSTL